jgi:hypothetical protein
MTDLPKSVRDQLARAQVPATPHPDADLLTAYYENSLGAAERQRVTEHVAVCPECREVLFLAQPESAPAQIVAKPAPARRFGWMVWASVAAVTVVIGSAVVIQKTSKPEQPVTVATTTKPTNIPSEHLEYLSPNAEAKKSTRSERDKLALARPPAKPMPTPESSKLDSAPSEVAALDEKSKDSSAQAGGLAADQTTQNYQNTVAARQAPSGPAQANSANVTNVYTAQNTAPAAAPMQKARKSEVPRDASASLGYAQSTSDLMKLESARAHWRISKAGVLERSYVNNDWTPVSVGSDVVFRVISIVGNVVWAGGTNGSLYVSRDGGTHWAPIKIETTADIVSIHFDDEANGKIQTSDGKTWKTSDAGNSWTPN